MMNKKIVLRILAYLGTGLVWIPIAAPFFFTFLRLMQGGSLLFDFLMLAEFFPLVMIGGFLLLIAAWLSKTRQPHITWGLGIAVFSLAASQLSAEATGMASGRLNPRFGCGHWRLGLLALDCICVVLVGIGGFRLI